MKENELKPFDKVLVRADNDCQWKASIFSHYNDGKAVCVSNQWKYCIPYEGNEHLLGTTDDYVELYVPKDGDFVTFVSYVSEIKFTAICKSYNNYDLDYYVGTIGRERDVIHLYSTYSLDSRDVVKPATDSEKQQLLDALHKERKDWDAAKKEIIEYKCRPKYGERYWYIDDSLCIQSHIWLGSPYGEGRYSIGNCFRTEAEAKTMADKFKKLLKGE